MELINNDCGNTISDQPLQKAIDDVIATFRADSVISEAYKVIIISGCEAATAAAVCDYASTEAKKDLYSTVILMTLKWLPLLILLYLVDLYLVII